MFQVAAEKPEVRSDVRNVDTTFKCGVTTRRNLGAAWRNRACLLSWGGRIRLDEDSSLEYAYHDGGDELHLFVETTYGDRERLLNLKPVLVLGD